MAHRPRSPSSARSARFNQHRASVRSVAPGPWSRPAANDTSPHPASLRLSPSEEKLAAELLESFMAKVAGKLSS